MAIFSCTDDSSFENPDVNESANLTKELSSICDNIVLTPSEPLTPLFNQVIDASDPIYNGDLLALVEDVHALGTLGGVTIYFPEGLYIVNAQPSGGPGIPRDRSELFFDGMENGLEILGDGPNSIIRLSDDPLTPPNCSPHNIFIRASSNVTIRNIAIDGNRIAAPTPSDCLDSNDNIRTNRHNILISGCTNVDIRWVSSTNAWGDALNFRNTEDIVVRNSLFDETFRNGISLGTGEEGIRDLRIQGNRFGSFIETQQIDFEGGDVYTDIVIRDNCFDLLDSNSPDASNQRAITLSEIRNDFEGSTSTGTHARVLNNEFNQNSVLIRSSNFLNFNNNFNVGYMEIDRNSSHIEVARNTFNINLTARITSLPMAAGDNIRSGILIRLADASDNDDDGIPDRQISNIVLQTNHIIIQEEFLRAIEVEDATAVTLRNNTIINDSGFTEMIGIRLEARRVDTEVNIVNPGEIIGFDNIIQIRESSNPNFPVEVTCTGNGCDL